ncbi:N-acetylglucosamine-specific PTS transporter subunit IIBC [Clostridiaceae bacterium HFYG-1003]|nr:N-acetylglucosamine-specific PTS transporter subunit IIBC [Clostridiaceae bacterium HFYG-1003]
MNNFFQKLGKSFMLPVSILPVISILFGLGFALDYRGWGQNSIVAAILIKAGGALIDNIPLLFAVGIPVGMSKDRDGAAALSGLAGFLVLRNLLSPESVAMYRKITVAEVNPAFGRIDNVFIGILVGILAALLYDRFSRKELPAALSFFSGRRLVPILTVLSSVVLAGILYVLWPILFGGLVEVGTAIQGMGALGAGIYGFLNRLLIPTGLHHALNAVFWFDTIGINDLGNFWASHGIQGITGRYMGGYFPIMMFGLPGAALAMYHTARPERKKVVGSMLLAGSISAFVTGLTEPIEFLFMFLSPLLYLVHSLLTGVSLFLSAFMQWTAGFNFSAGLIDWFFSTFMPLANQPVMLLVQGLAFFVIYYVVFRWFILKFNLQTPGREADSAEDHPGAVSAGEKSMSAPNSEALSGSSLYQQTARRIYQGLGGSANVVAFDSCATRVRVEVRDSGQIDQELIRSAGITNVLINGPRNVQVIVGPKVQFVADAMHEVAQETNAE